MTNYKFILYGDYGVGKSSLVNRLIHDNFDPTLQQTIGATFVSWKPMSILKNPNDRFGIWDTAGQERFHYILPMYLRESHAVFYCWDYNVPFNYQSAEKMLTEAKAHSPNCLFYLMITKIDRSNDLDYRMHAAEAFAREKNLTGIFYSSSLTGVGVESAFMTVAEQIIDTFTEPIVENVKLKKTAIVRSKCC